MSQSYKEYWKMLMEDQRKVQSICGTIELTFQFTNENELQYNVEDCQIEYDQLLEDEMQNYDGPDDLNINYYYSNEKGEEVKIDIENYEIDDISDLNDQNDSLEEGNSLFDVSCIMISPNHQFILICVNVQILRKKESQRLIIIDIYNHKIQKLFYRSNFLGDTNPQFSKDGNFALINITNDTEQSISKCLFLDLKNRIQKVLYFQTNQPILRIEYDDQSNCFFYITHLGTIYQQPFNFENYNIDRSKRQKYKINQKFYQFLENHDTHLYILVDYFALIVNQKGQYIITRIKKNCKIIKNYIFENYYPKFISKKPVYVVAADPKEQTFLLINISIGKLIRKKHLTQQFQKSNYYYDSQNQSYHFSYQINCLTQGQGDNEDNINQEQRRKWMIFDFIRGIQKQVNQTWLTQEQIKTNLFTNKIVIQNYQNKISFQLKL
ncbi:unnamed protein product [Paramecium pentaurelia]|uniref:Uncharacterized protein n=1 Tax=Paramecium pentaurelia TaxID=43138 RepID=A0A8S1YJJ6_9CILI|nr:unnamed protein product [Paramecium pentaurelia]